MYSIHAALPYNPINLPFAKQLQLDVFVVQGWKFFTRNPREEDIFVYKKDGYGNWLPALVGVNGSPVNFFGLRRSTRAQGVEIGLITTAIKQDQWYACRQSAETCVTDAPMIGFQSTHLLEPTLCGEIGLVLRPPIPWAWSRARKEIIMPSKGVRVNLLCSKVY